METTLNEVKNDVTSLKVKDEVNVEDEEEGGFLSNLNPMNWFGGDDEEGSEGFSNEDNNLFFMLAIIVILYYCLKR